MPWTFHQSSGRINKPDGTLMAYGYAGHGIGVNNPLKQDVPMVGPLPRGTYTLGEPLDKPNTGPFSIPLTPDPSNDMLGRSAFYIHGDNAAMNMTASEGCIVVARWVREAMWNSGDHTLTVVV